MIKDILKLVLITISGVLVLIAVMVAIPKDKFNEGDCVISTEYEGPYIGHLEVTMVSKKHYLARSCFKDRCYFPYIFIQKDREKELKKVSCTEFE